AGFALRIGDRALTAGCGEDRAGIADLAARLAVERRLVDDKADLVTSLRLGNVLLALNERQDDPLGALGFVAEEFGRAELFAQGEPYRLGCRLAGADPGSARARPRLLHLAIEAGGVDAHAVTAQDVLRQVERKPVGVVQHEGD